MHYGLEMESKAGKAALQGTIVHQVFEWMIKLKKNGKTNVDPMWLLDRAWDEHTKKSSEVDIRRTTTRRDKETGEFKEAADFKKCKLAIEEVVGNKYYNPYDSDVVDSEQWFALELPGDEWECKDNNGKTSQFKIRGFIDFLRLIDEKTIEIIDWKTGKRQNFYTQQTIDELSLPGEIQARLYHFAVSCMYPQYENILVTFYYTNDGGPITISLSDKDIVNTIAILHNFFKAVTKDTLIRRNRHWSCKMCGYGNNGMCDKIWSDLHTMGTEYIVCKYHGLSQQEQLTMGKPGEQ